MDCNEEIMLVFKTIIFIVVGSANVGLVTRCTNSCLSRSKREIDLQPRHLTTHLRSASNCSQA